MASRHLSRHPHMPPRQDCLALPVLCGTPSPVHPTEESSTRCCAQQRLEDSCCGMHSEVHSCPAIRLCRSTNNTTGLLTFLIWIATAPAPKNEGQLDDVVPCMNTGGRSSHGSIHADMSAFVSLRHTLTHLHLGRLHTWKFPHSVYS